MYKKEIKTNDGTNIVLEQINGKEEVQDFLYYINELVEEKAEIFIDRFLSLEEEQKWLEEELKANEEGGSIYLKALAEGKLVGTCIAKKGLYKEKENAELGIALLKKWRGRGLGKKMLEELIKLVKKEWNSRLIHLHVFEKNTKAISLYKSLGFKEVARLPEWVNNFGEIEDKIVMRLQ